MSDFPKPSLSSSGSQAGNKMKKQISAPSLSRTVSGGSGGNANATASRLKINRPGAAGGKVLLPSKVMVPQPQPSNSTTASSSLTRKGSLKRKSVQQLPPTRPTMTQSQLADLQYSQYLQCYLERVLMEEVSQLSKQVQLDGLAGKCVNLGVVENLTKKIHADRKILRFAANLNQLAKIRSAFDNMVDFTGEETLMEIHGILTNKYDKLRVEGVVVNDPLFQDNEMEKILEVLRLRLCKNEEELKVMDWCSQYVEKLKKLTVKEENSKREDKMLEIATNVLLERCSLLACELAQEQHEAIDEEIFGNVLSLSEENLKEPKQGKSKERKT